MLIPVEATYRPPIYLNSLSISIPLKLKLPTTNLPYSVTILTLDSFKKF